MLSNAITLQPDSGSVRAFDIAIIPLRAKDGSVRAYAIVDLADADWANQWKWCLNNSGYAFRYEYQGTQPLGVLLHRELLGLVYKDGLEGDHINRNRLDCRRSNLRIVTHRQNLQNQTTFRRSRSRYRGVSQTAYGKWKACVHVNGKTIHIGHFSDELDAARAAQEARKRLLPFSEEADL